MTTWNYTVAATTPEEAHEKMLRYFEMGINDGSIHVVTETELHEILHPPLEPDTGK